MLILTRREGESIRIGDDITVCICRTSQGQVKLGIAAPKEVLVLREELAIPRHADSDVEDVRLDS